MGNRISVLTTEIIRVIFCRGMDALTIGGAPPGVEGAEPAPDPDLGTS
jgi:hypothetical protein